MARLGCPRYAGALLRVMLGQAETMVALTEWSFPIETACRREKLRCRQIDEPDIEAVASFLARGFPAHDRGFWLDAFARLTKHGPPPGFPKYGYLLESDRVVVGAILL